MTDNLTFYHNYVYQLYNCNAIGVNDNNSDDIIFYDSYNDNLYKSYSWSIKYKFIDDIINYYENNKTDHMIYNYINKSKIYVCGINMMFNTIKISDKKYVISDYDKYNIKKKIDKYIQPRTLIYNVKNVIYNPMLNNKCSYFNFRHFTITSLNSNILFITISSLNDDIINNEVYKFIIDDKIVDLYFDSSYGKTTFAFNIYNNIIEHNNYNFCIFQTNYTILLDIYEIYALSSILSYLPEIKYYYYDDNACVEYIKKNDFGYGYLDCYNRIIPTAYKSDLFRCLKLLNESGIYFDFKMMLLQNITKYIDTNVELFCRDLDNIGIYNEFMYTDKIKNPKLQNYLNKIMDNIKNENYGDNALSPTGPNILKLFINNPLCKFIVLSDIDLKSNEFGYITLNKNIIIKNVYNFIKHRNKYYLHANHYGSYWDNSLVYNNFNFYLENINIDYDIIIIVLSVNINNIIENSIKNQKNIKRYIKINNIEELKELKDIKDDTKILLICNPINEYLIDTLNTFLYCYELYQPYFCWNVGNNKDKEVIFNDNTNFISTNTFEMLFEYKDIDNIFFNNVNNLYNCQITKNIYKNIYSDVVVLVNSNKIFNISNSKKCIITNKKQRHIIKNLNNIIYNPDDNINETWYIKVNILLTYLSKNVFLLTIYSTEIFDCNIVKICLRINDQKIIYNLNFNCNTINKKTFLIYTNTEIELINNEPIYDYSIFQTYKNNNIEVEKYYTICSILSYIPNVEYIYYDDIDAVEYLKSINNELVNYYNNLVPGAYKSDLFRAIRLFYDKGIYFDCKHILLGPLLKYFKNEKQYYCNDIEDSTYNGFLFYNSNDLVFLKYINNVLDNLYNKEYGINQLDITSCRVLFKYYNIIVNPNLFLLKHFHHVVSNEFCIGFLYLIENNLKIIQTGYSLNYYTQEYFKNHYNKLWIDRKVYNNIKLDYIQLNSCKNNICIEEHSNEDYLNNNEIQEICDDIIIDDSIIDDSNTPELDDRYILESLNPKVLDFLKKYIDKTVKELIKK